jgi:hypothetical protein
MTSCCTIQSWSFASACVHATTHSPSSPQTPNHPRAARPAACPNPGFMAALLELDGRLHGGRGALGRAGAALMRKRGKPAALICPVCGEPAGVSRDSLAVHVRARHRGMRLAAEE